MALSGHGTEVRCLADNFDQPPAWVRFHVTAGRATYAAGRVERQQAQDWDETTERRRHGMDTGYYYGVWLTGLTDDGRVSEHAPSPHPEARRMVRALPFCLFPTFTVHSIA